MVPNLGQSKKCPVSSTKKNSRTILKHVQNFCLELHRALSASSTYPCHIKPNNITQGQFFCFKYWQPSFRGFHFTRTSDDSLKQSLKTARSVSHADNNSSVVITTRAHSDTFNFAPLRTRGFVLSKQKRYEILARWRLNLNTSCDNNFC